MSKDKDEGYRFRDQDSDPQIADHRATSVDLPQINTGASGAPTKFIRMTAAICQTCKGATGGARYGVIKDLGGGGLTLECENPNCRQTMHAHVSQLPR